MHVDFNNRWFAFITCLVLILAVFFLLNFLGRGHSDSQTSGQTEELLTTVAVTLAWDPPIASSTPTPTPAPGYSLTHSYKLYYGPASGSYTTAIPVNYDSQMMTVAGLQPSTWYYFAVTALDKTCWPGPAPGCATLESADSNETAWIAPTPSPTPTQSPVPIPHASVGVWGEGTPVVIATPQPGPR